MSAPLLSVRALDAWYGRAQALHGASFDVAAGEVLALVGPNGAGKSTLLKAVLGLVDARGEVLLDGRRIDALDVHQRVRLGLGWVPEDRRVFGDLTVRENLAVPAVARPSASRGPEWSDARLDALFPNLAEARNRRAATLSGGEQQMLSIARTLATRPAIVLLDEPSEGLAPRVVEAMARSVIEMKRAGLAVVLSEQNAHFASAVADRTLRIASGRVAESIGGAPT